MTEHVRIEFDDEARTATPIVANDFDLSDALYAALDCQCEEPDPDDDYDTCEECGKHIPLAVAQRLLDEDQDETR